MSWNFLDVLDVVIDALELLGSGSKRDPGNVNKFPKSKPKYIMEMASAGFILASVILFIIVFRNPLPMENGIQTFVVASLIGVALSFLVFFVLHVLELYYFKDIFMLLLFSGSMIAFFISGIVCVYFRSGIFI